MSDAEDDQLSVDEEGDEYDEEEDEYYDEESEGPTPAGNAFKK